MSFGFTYERTRIDAVDFSYTPGDNTFNGQRTGNAVADFYLGLDSNFFQDNGRKFYLRENRVGLYVQDDWKVTRELTLNLGVRWDPWLPPIDTNQTLVGFIPGQQSTVAPLAPLGLVFNGDAGVVPSIFHNNYKDFAPRVGFAYNLGGKGATVVRAGYGIFYGFPEGLLYQRTDAAQPIDLYLNIPNPPSWDNIYAGFPGGDPFPRAHFTTSQFKTYNFITPFSGGVLNPNSKVGYTQDYNVTVEQQLPFKLFSSLSWIGNHGVHIMGSRQFNPAVCAAGAPCSNLNNSTCTTCTTGNENSRRLYPGLGAVELADSYEYELYNALQFNVTRRVAKGMTILTNFTWSKSIDNTSSAIEGVAGPPNPFNLNSARGPADYDQKFRYNTAINYLTPKYSGGPLGRALLNGYAFNLIANLYSGFPFTVLSGTDRSLSGIGNDYADIVPGVNPHATTNPNRLAQYFNPAAFTQAALGTFGNSSRNSLRGPGYQDIDVSFFKDFFTENRIHGQFRAEGFNIINHPNFANPNSTVSTAATDGVVNNVVSNTSANVGPRVFQFGAKIIF